MKSHKKLKNFFFGLSLGFSLVEIIVAAGMASGLSLALLNLTKNMNKSSKTAFLDTEITFIKTDINTILSGGINCKQTLTGTTIPTTSTQKIPIAIIKKQTAQTTWIDAYKTGADGTNESSVTGSTYLNGQMAIGASLRFDNTTLNRPSDYYIELVFYKQKAGGKFFTAVTGDQTYFGANNVIRKIYVNITPDSSAPTKVGNCLAYADLSWAAAAVKAACQGTGAHYVEPTPTAGSDSNVIGGCFLYPSPAGCNANEALKEVKLHDGKIVATCIPNPAHTPNCTTGRLVSDANGNLICDTTKINIDQNNECLVADQFAKKIDINGKLVCGNSLTGLNTNCGAAQYVRNIVNGVTTCGNLPVGPCDPNSYLKSVDSSGKITCALLPANTQTCDGIGAIKSATSCASYNELVNNSTLAITTVPNIVTSVDQLSTRLSLAIKVSASPTANAIAPYKYIDNSGSYDQAGNYRDSWGVETTSCANSLSYVQGITWTWSGSDGGRHWWYLNSVNCKTFDHP
ncbi:MAG: hypothetical protein HQK51_21250 [Oligoflexia bacterium]|nr:hypothetical protein [Oligoflexia bacterium]